MNRSCSVCDSPATRVCQHKNCTLSPFLCSGPCAKNASEKLHTHKSEQNFISYEEFEKRAERTNKLLDPYNLHKEYLEEMRKKVDVTKEHLKKKIDDCLERFYPHIQNNICVEIKLQLTEEEKVMVQKIKGDFNNNILLSGKDLSELWKNQYTFIGQRYVEEAVKCMKRAYYQQLQEIEGLFIKQKDEFPSYSKIVTESRILFREGWKLFNDNQYYQALVELKKVRQINNFHASSHLLIGDCLFKMDRLNEAEESYHSALLLYPYYISACGKIGQINLIKKNFEEAINWFQKAIQINKDRSGYYSKRGECFFQLKRFEQATVDYFIASKLEPNKEQYKTKIEEIGKLMKTK